MPFIIEQKSKIISLLDDLVTYLQLKKNNWQTLKAPVFPFNYLESINFEQKVIERIIHSRVQFCALMKCKWKDLFYEGDIFANA